MDMLRIRTVTTGVAGAPFYTNLYFGTALGTAAQAHAAVTAFWTSMRDFISSSLTMRVEGEIAIIDSDTGEQTGSASVTGTTVTGAQATNNLPPATQGLIRWRTGNFVGGRRLQGRTFIPGVTVALSSNGEPSGDYIAKMQDSANALIAAASVDLLIFSKTKFVAQPVLSASPWSRFAVLRSRRD